MEGGEVAYDGGTEFGQLWARHLVEVIDNLAGSAKAPMCLEKVRERERGEMGENEEGLTLPLSVVAAKSLAAASAAVDSSMAKVVVQASCYSSASAHVC